MGRKGGGIGKGEGVGRRPREVPSKGRDPQLRQAPPNRGGAEKSKGRREQREAEKSGRGRKQREAETGGKGREKGKGGGKGAKEGERSPFPIRRTLSDKLPPSRASR